MDKPLLSICIPTYNRANYLKECLDSIVCQFEDKNIFNQVEIVISDNASSDDTIEIIEGYRKKFNNILYFRHGSNIGAPKNVINCLDKAGGQYLWLLGDDDIISSDSLRYLLKRLPVKRYSAVLLNFSQGEHKNPKIKLHVNSLGISEDKEYVKYEDFFRGDDFKNFHGINFLSALIYDKAFYYSNKSNFTPFLNTCYLQSYIFMIVAKNGNILRIASPLVTWRSNIARRYGENQESEDKVSRDFEDYIKFSKTLGYVFDEERFLSLQAPKKIALKFRLYNFLRDHNLLNIAKIFYRIPRILRYYLKK